MILLPSPPDLSFEMSPTTFGIYVGLLNNAPTTSEFDYFGQITMRSLAFRTAMLALSVPRGANAPLSVTIPAVSSPMVLILIERNLPPEVGAFEKMELSQLSEMIYQSTLPYPDPHE